MPETRNDAVLELARAVHGRLPAELIAPHEHEDFTKNAELWRRGAADDSRARGSGYGLGLQDIVPEATALALFTAKTAMGSAIEAGLGRLWHSLTGRRRGRRDLPAALSDAQREKVRARIFDRQIKLGVSEQTAAVFADSLVAELSENDGEPGR